MKLIQRYKNRSSVELYAFKFNSCYSYIQQLLADLNKLCIVVTKTNFSYLHCVQIN